MTELITYSSNRYNILFIMNEPYHFETLMSLLYYFSQTNNVYVTGLQHTYHEAQKRNDEGSLNMSETYDNYTYHEAQRCNDKVSLNISKTYDNYIVNGTLRSKFSLKIFFQNI